MTSFGLCKVFDYKYSTTGHNFTEHYYVLHIKVTRCNGDLAQVQSGGLDLEDPETFRLKILVALCVV